MATVLPSTLLDRVRDLASRPASRQLLRYIVAGLGVTQAAALVYTLLVLQGLSPYLANAGSTSFGLMLGYAVHSRWSFRESQGGSEALQLGRFLTASGVAFLINNLWIWLTTQLLHLPPLAAVPLMMAATPCLSFLLNRYWVFRAA